MEDLEHKVVSDNNIILWNTYVDGVFSITKTEQVDKLYHFYNGDRTKLSNSIPGRVSLTRTDNGKIKTQVYQKKTRTDQILNYHSNHPTQHKISCIRTLFN